MIEVYKIFSVKYDATVTNWLMDRHLESHYDLRGHRFSLYQSQIHYDTRKYNFTNRIIAVWNGVPDTVISATTVDTFKARLKIDFSKTKKLFTTGSRSLHILQQFLPERPSLSYSLRPRPHNKTLITKTSQRPRLYH